MLQVENRKSLEDMFSRKLQVAQQVAESASEVKPLDATPTSIALGVVVESLNNLTQEVSKNRKELSSLTTAVNNRPKQLVADVHRDKDGKMYQVVISLSN
jgi:hypothetical protein